jgi:hypothetical protein
MQVIDYHEAIFASKLSSNARLTALIIASYYNWSKNEMCWPSNKTLSQGTNLCISSLVRAKKELVNNGYLLVHRRIDNSNLYKPLIPQNNGYVLTEQKVWSDRQTNNEYNNEVNNEKDNKTSFNNSFNLIDTGHIIDLSSETIATGTALKELTPAEIDELLSW